VLTNGIVVAVLAQQEVDVTIRSDDGAPVVYTLQPGEGRSFAADMTLRIELSHGASAHVWVSGVDQGFPGKADGPWHDTYSFAESSPSP
jgi:hypothetical protein